MTTLFLMSAISGAADSGTHYCTTPSKQLIVIKNYHVSGKLRNSSFMRAELVENLGQKSVLVECSDSINAKRNFSQKLTQPIVKTILVDNNRIYLPTNVAWKSNGKVYTTVGRSLTEQSIIIENSSLLMPNDYQIIMKK